MTEIEHLRREIKGDIIVPASAGLVESLINNGMLDELQLIVHPVILGSGKRFLQNIETRHNMKLIFSKLYEPSGSMLMRYEFVKQ
jgi:dihydrofolate reductase